MMKTKKWCLIMLLISLLGVGCGQQDGLDQPEQEAKAETKEKTKKPTTTEPEQTEAESKESQESAKPEDQTQKEDAAQSDSQSDQASTQGDLADTKEQIQNGDYSILIKAIKNTLPNQPFRIVLRNQNEYQFELNAQGTGDGTKLEQPVYRTIEEDINREPLPVRRMRQGEKFYTIVDQLKKADYYKTSCYEGRFFDLVNTKFEQVGENKEQIIYTFYDDNTGSVSDLIEFYSYIIDKAENRLQYIEVYQKEQLNSVETVGDMDRYQIIETGQPDPTVFEIPSDYEIITPLYEHCDGEHMPFWYQPEEE